jgi:hypothetical protein
VPTNLFILNPSTDTIIPSLGSVVGYAGIVHEICFNPEFVVASYGATVNGVQLRMGDPFQSRLWCKFEEELAMEIPSYASLCTLFHEIYKFIGTIPDHGTSSSLLSLPDTKLDKLFNGIDGGVFNLVHFKRVSSVVTQTLKGICARVGADSDHKRWNFIAKGGGAPGIVRDTMASLMSLVVDLKVVTLNREVRAVVPILLKHGCSYEIAQYEGTFGGCVRNTHDWLHSTLVRLHSARDSRIDLAGIADGDVSSIRNLMCIAYVDLICDYPNWGGKARDAKEIPETMWLEMLRIRCLNNRFRSSVMSGVLIKTVAAERHELVGAMDVVLRDSNSRSLSVEELVDVFMDEVAYKISTEESFKLRFVLMSNVQVDSDMYSSEVREYKEQCASGMLKHCSPNGAHERLCSCVPRDDRLHKSIGILHQLVKLNESLHYFRYQLIVMNAAKELGVRFL